MVRRSERALNGAIPGDDPLASLGEMPQMQLSDARDSVTPNF